MAGQDHSVDVLAGRVLFSDDAKYNLLDRRFAEGDVIKATKLSEEFGLDEFHTEHPEALIMFLVDPTGHLTICTTDAERTSAAGQTVIALVSAEPMASSVGYTSRGEE